MSLIDAHPDLRLIPVEKGLHEQHPDLGLIPVEQDDPNPLQSLALSPASQHDLRIVAVDAIPREEESEDTPEREASSVTAEDLLEQFEEMKTEDGL